MKCLLEVCLVAVTLAANVTPVAARSPVADPGLKMIRRTEATALAAQALQKGISVQLPVAGNPTPMPDADQEGALIVSVTDDGNVYFGITPVNSYALAERITSNLPNQPERKLYIKADARTPYANVLKVLEAMHSAGVATVNLLTAQAGPSDAGTLVPPKGLEVLVGQPSSSSAESPLVQVLNSGQRWPALKINNEQIPWTDLQSTLVRVLQNGREKVVQVKAEGTLPFADVVTVTDTCRSMGAKVILVRSGL